MSLKTQNSITYKYKVKLKKKMKLGKELIISKLSSSNPIIKNFFLMYFNKLTVLQFISKVITVLLRVSVLRYVPRYRFQ